MSSTMKVRNENKTRMINFSNYPKEPLDNILERVLDYYALDNTLTPQEIKDVQEGLDDIKAGRVYTTKELNKKLGL